MPNIAHAGPVDTNELLPLTNARALLLTAAWFGILAGLVEGGGLLIFQSINWRSWGVITHVSLPILWISPLVDLVVFLSIASTFFLLRSLLPTLPAFRILVLVLTTLTLYDWLLIPRRLTHVACFLLAAGIGTVFSRWLAGRQTTAMRLWRRTLPALAILLALVFIAIQGGKWWSERRELAHLPAAAPGSPNVLVIVIDTLRADHLSAYGYARPTTPNIDRLAREGVLFENAIAASSWTFPSHVSLLTGEYLFENGMGKIPPLPLWTSQQIIRSPLIGEDLERRGYRTGAFSGNRICFDHNLGFGRGFIHFEDYFFSFNDTVSRTVLGRIFGRLFLSRGLVQRIVAQLGWENDPDVEGTTSRWKKHVMDSRPRRKRAAEVNREALNWIDSGPHSHPFFAFLNYFDVHENYGGPPSFRKTWSEDKRIDQYDNGVQYADSCVAELMAGLARRHLDRNTLVVVTADHGEMFGEHGLDNHGKSLYWDLIHVPLIFWYPGQIPPGVRIPHVVSITSLATTLSTWLPGPRQTQSPGLSLSRLWDGTNASAQFTEPVLAELAFNSYEFDLKTFPKYPFPADLEGPMKSLVAGQWHLITHQTLGDQLYDVTKDPHENVDLINTPQGRDVAGLLSGKMLDLLAGRDHNHTDAKPIELQLGNKAPGEFVRRITDTSRLNDTYILHANGGSTIHLEMQAPQPAGDLSPILAVEDSAGKVLGSCRNPQDDRLAAPGVSDPTPEAFDDLCVSNAGDPNAHTALRLDVKVPGKESASMDLYIRIVDWDGKQAAAGTSYRIRASLGVATRVAQGRKVVAAGTTYEISSWEASPPPAEVAQAHRESSR